MNNDNAPRSGEYIPGSERTAGWRVFDTRIIRVPTYRAFSFGTMLAIAISYVHNQSIGWAIVHGLLSWFFVIYAALFY
jgi:hypothetical protein